jgi:hypothetical protein
LIGRVVEGLAAGRRGAGGAPGKSLYCTNLLFIAAEIANPQRGFSVFGIELIRVNAWDRAIPKNLMSIIWVERF